MATYSILNNTPIIIFEIFLLLFLIPTLFPKPCSYYRYFIREYHFLFQGLGISGWGIWFFFGGIGEWS